jgi:hypothetical protein
MVCVKRKNIKEKHKKSSSAGLPQVMIRMPVASRIHFISFIAPQCGCTGQLTLRQSRQSREMRNSPHRLTSLPES